jgi:hypothetical protein
MWRQASCRPEKPSLGKAPGINQGLIPVRDNPPGWKPRLYVSQDG